jgi:hypothetical protein
LWDQILASHCFYSNQWLAFFEWMYTFGSRRLMAKKETFHSVVTFLLLAALCAVGYLWYTGQLIPRGQVVGEHLSGATGLLTTESQFREKLAELRMQREKVQRGIQRLEDFKVENISKLKEMGISSGTDFINSTDRDVKLAVVNLKGWVAQIAKIKQEVTYYDDAISNVEVMLDKIERERIDESVSLSEDEYMELQKIIIDLNERLNVETDILEDEELGKLLDLEMVGSANPNGN